MRTAFAIFAGLAIAGCQAADPPAVTGKPAGATGDVTLYKYAGSRQCSGGGISPEDARRALAAAGVQVLEAGCGADGRMHTASCGGADGRIVIVKVAARDAAAARGQGFAPLSELPDAARARCP
jgi:hypothetical protein